MSLELKIVSAFFAVGGCIFGGNYLINGLSGVKDKEVVRTTRDARDTRKSQAINAKVPSPKTNP